ncbi:MAG: DUF2281 domain-containing protein [Halothece sp.]
MNTNPIKNRLLEKINTLSEEQLSSILSFVEELENKSDDQKNSQSPKSEKNLTVLERLGGVPKNLIKGGGNLSDREVRKKTIAQKIKQKYD